MKGLLILIGLSFSISACSQNNTIKTDWDNGRGWHSLNQKIQDQ